MKYVGGMAVSGVGTGINELVVIAGTSELVPVSQRGYYLAAVGLAIIPLLPSVMYAQLISFSHTWRYIAILTSGLAAVALAITVVFYSPPPPSLERQRSREDDRSMLRNTDFLGGLLSIAGLAGVEVGLLGGGYQVSKKGSAADIIAAQLITGH